MSDIYNHHIIFHILPKKWHPYAILARWDRPIGTWLLYLPCLWGLGLAQHQAPTDNGLIAFYAILMGIGAILMRGVGCCWNDITDKDFDAKVARTQDRPLASGALRLPQALLFIIFQLALALIILAFLPMISGIMAFASLPLIIIYPYMKRMTWFPQAWLGLTFNWGVFVGYVTIYGLPQSMMGWLILLGLYAAGFWWTMGYDMIYAHQDKEDDALIGVKSTARFFGDHSRLALFGFYFLMILCLGLSVFFAGGMNLYAIIGFVIVVFALIWQGIKVDFNNPKDCLFHFKFNRFIGLAIALILLIGI